VLTLTVRHQLNLTCLRLPTAALYIRTHAHQTLLHVAAQNGNRRIAKLCLRRGAAVNTQTFNGQTALHYAFGYGFEALGEYLISKGADDSITNAQGLTCYEGLSADELSKM
jgi:ankyrin repeat protein